jgi:DNA-binding response OmpR family regulator
LGLSPCGYSRHRAGTKHAGLSILLVDDEDAIQKLLTFPLQKDGYRVIEARDGEAALRRFEEEEVDLVVLDLALPKLDGLEVCRRLRARSAVPIIMLTARDEEIDKVIGLEIGADDYITKPFSIREFRSRVRALLRRASLTPASSSAAAIEVGPLRVDPARRRVEVDGEGRELTYVEFELLRCLAEQPGRVYSRFDLLEKIWGSSQYRDPRTVDVHVRHLREKLERDPSKPELILTIRGVGYRLREP